MANERQAAVEAIVDAAFDLFTDVYSVPGGEDIGRDYKMVQDSRLQSLRQAIDALDALELRL
jgi:hypothetical protein